MVLNPDNGKTIKIIDRTIPEVYSCRCKMSRLDIIDLCWMLKDIGVDMIEINGGVLKKVEKLPSGIDFLFRIVSEEDIQACIIHNIKNCIIDEETLLKSGYSAANAANGINLTVEFKADDLAGIRGLKKLKSLRETYRINTFRITGLNKFTSLSWVGIINRMAEELNVSVDICPENRFYTATAAAVEAMAGGTDFVTGSFMGYGRQCKYAPLEEILLSAKVLINPEIKADLSILPTFGRRFKKITGINIPDNKPVIGKDIFRYESGIHADGIQKDPSTYEPFEPDIVGQKRRLSIGKHSGRKSVIKKLTELGVDYRNEKVNLIVKSIRDKSIKLKRALRDEEIIEICGVKGTS